MPYLPGYNSTIFAHFQESGTPLTNSGKRTSARTGKTKKCISILIFTYKQIIFSIGILGIIWNGYIVDDDHDLLMQIGWTDMPYISNG